jgi:asparagine synthase (glutamine-hydrolysing)
LGANKILGQCPFLEKYIMCGILVTVADQKLQSDTPGLSIIEHRGPDGFGVENFQLDDSCFLGLGHRRLSIIDLSERGKQPMSSANNRFCITYNGEIYNYREIRDELKNDGFTFRSDSDTEVLIAAYAKWGRACLDKLNGMFAFAVYDTIENKLFIARDRFGIKPLYFLNSKKEFILASEIKQINAFESYQANVDKMQLYHYLNFGDFSFSDKTMWQNIFELEGGCCCEIDFKQWRPGDNLNIQQWYTIPNDEILDISFDEAATQFRNLLDESVKLRLRADVNIGFLLSGGHDSSTLVGIAHKNSRYKNSKLRTYSSCYDDPAIDERKFIKSVVEFTGADSCLHFPSPLDFENNIDKVIWHNDIPVRMGSPSPHWLIYQHIKNEKDNRKVILEGQGADEILCGYGDFRWAALYEKMSISQLPSFLLDFISFYKRYHPHPKYFYRKFMRMKYPDKVKYPSSPVIDSTFLLNGSALPSIPLRREAPTIRELHIERMKILRYILHNVDRNSMAHSRETRVPFLDHNLVEFCLKLPPEHKMKGGISKRVLRESVHDVIPEKVRNRVDKQGYSSPIAKWAQKELKGFFEKNLIEVADLPFVNSDFIASELKSFHQDGRHFDPALWRVIAATKWINMFNIKL